MNIEKYSDKDFQACVELFINVFNQDPWNDRWEQDHAKDYLSDYIHTPGFIGVVAKEGSSIQGFIFGFRKRWWSGDEFYINEMCVDQALQRNGIGTELLNYLRDLLKGENISRITLLTDKGIIAEKFYEKNGFNEIERLIFMCKEID